MKKECEITKVKILVAITLLSGILMSCSNNSQMNVPKYSIEQFMNTTSLFGNSFSFNEKQLLFTSNKTGVYNIYSVSVEGENVKQLSFSKDSSMYAISYLPKDNRLLYQSDQGGNERWQILMMDETGNTRSLTPEGKRSLFVRWKYDGTGFYYTSNARDARNMDVYFMDLSTLLPEMIFQNNSAYTISTVSNDGSFIGLQKIFNRNYSKMLLVNVADSSITPLSNYNEWINNEPLCFSPDSKELYFITDENSEFKY